MNYEQLRGSMIYCVYPRAHGPQGHFEDVRRDLGRIRALGADVLWLMPIHPVGAVQRKGSLGSPYAVRDYRAVNPEYGTLEEFVALLDEAHRLGLRVLMDVVYNHTAPDSVLYKTHPEWFYRDAEGRPGNRNGDWSDVIDLDFAHEGLRNELMDTLVYWARLGVDGFRCDVASAVPAQFWRDARARVEAVRPGAIWLAESVHPWFVHAHRAAGHACCSDGELYTAFDVTYDYDIHDLYAGYFAGKNSLDDYLAAMRAQEATYPAHYLKLRFLENHDQPRAAALMEEQAADRWLAFQFFAKGTALLYAGQEARAQRTPSLFEREAVDLETPDRKLCAQLRRLMRLRRSEVFRRGVYTMELGELPGVALCRYRLGTDDLVGVFDLEGRGGTQRVPLADGSYVNLLNQRPVQVRGGRVNLGQGALVLGGHVAAPSWAG